MRGEGGGVGVKVTGLTLIINNFEMNNKIYQPRSFSEL